METVFEAFAAWDGVSQAWFLLGLAALAVLGCVAVVRQLTHCVVVVLRGYPPDRSESLRDCNHDDNLTGRCLKVGGCKTVSECDAMVAANHYPIDDESEEA